MKVHGLAVLSAQTQIEHLDSERKSHGKVDITVGDADLFNMYPFYDQQYRDQDQKRKGQHFKSRILVNKERDFWRKNEHKSHRNHNSNDADHK